MPFETIPGTSDQYALLSFDLEGRERTDDPHGVGGLLHLTCELFKKSAGVDLLHVPYKGSTAFRPDLIEGRVTMAFDNVPVYVPLVTAGKLKILAVTAGKRCQVARRPQASSRAAATRPPWTIPGPAWWWSPNVSTAS